jgi:hypothetical protein
VNVKTMDADIPSTMMTALADGHQLLLPQQQQALLQQVTPQLLQQLLEFAVCFDNSNMVPDLCRLPAAAQLPGEA